MPTQVERSEATREKTIAATIECLVERGYAGATIAAVAERAGVSRGAVSHQYPDKHRLVVDVINEIGRRHTAGISAAMTSVSAGERRIGAGLDALWATAFKGPIYVAALEVYVAGRTDPGLAPEMLRLAADLEDALRDVVRAITGPTRSPEAVDLRAGVLINAMRGLALLHSVGYPPEPLEEIWAQVRADTVAQLTALADGRLS